MQPTNTLGAEEEETDRIVLLATPRITYEKGNT